MGLTPQLSALERSRLLGGIAAAQIISGSTRRSAQIYRQVLRRE